MHSRLNGLVAASVVAALLAVGPTVARRAAASDTVVVQAGDTLTAIAARHGLSIERLVAINHLDDPNRIYAGQTLRLKAPAAATGATVAAAARVHLVAYGETLTGIARRYGTTVAALAAANRLADAGRIYAGQRIAIPGVAGTTARPAPQTTPLAPAALTHRIASGETLTGIALHYGTTIEAIAAANGIADPSFVRAGTVLRIPGNHPTPRPAPPAMPVSMARLVAARDAIGDLVTAEAMRFGVSPALARAVAWQESGWQQGVTSHAGAIGVMQLLPATGEWVGPVMLGGPVNLYDAADNVRAGVRLLRHYLDRYHGDKARALAAYYQGQTAVDRHGIYPVSRPYIASILNLERLFG